MRRIIGLAALVGAGAIACGSPGCGEPAARNVVLFIGDAGGLPTLSAASIHGYGEPRRLFVQSMPQIALAETSTASEWVTDSAAGMTAIVTGQKTHNGVVAQSATAVRGKTDGEPLKTILEYAEERGLATGVVTNSDLLSATPAACYAHVNDRDHDPEILQNLLKPRFGDGVDVLMGGGRDEIVKAGGAVGINVLKTGNYAIYDAVDGVPGNSRRVAVLTDGDLDIESATRRAIDILSRHSRGFFLMVESDLHTEQIGLGLDHAVKLDRAIRETAGRLGDDTLILFTADHSYDFRVVSGRKGSPLAPGLDPLWGEDQQSIRLDHIRREDDHTAEEVLVAAKGPGSSRVRGILSNTDLFTIMLDAYGWRPAREP